MKIKKITVRKIIRRFNRFKQKIGLLIKKRTYEFYPLQLLTEEQNKSLEIKGIKKAHLESIYLRNSAEGDRGLPIYQEEIISNGQFNSICPICGKKNSSEKSFPLFIDGFDLPIFYRFKCCHEFYIITAKSPARIFGIYIEAKRVVISFENYKDYPHNLDNYGAKTFLHWIQELERLQKIFHMYDKPLKEINVKPLVLSGFLQNFGHHLTDEIGGLAQLNSDDFTKLKILLGPNDWFKLKSLLGIEDADESLTKKTVDFADFIFLQVLKNGGCATRITTNHPLSNKVSEKLMKISKMLLAEDKNKLLLEIQGAPIIWITLRSHYRAWDSQVDGLSTVINKMYTYFPDMTIVFDGFRDEVSSYELIKSKINPQIKVFSVLGFSIIDTIPFASNSDFYIAPLGAGVVITSIPNIPGIVHTHSEWAKKKSIVPSAREEGVLCTVIGGVITSGKDIFEFNYEISAQELFESVMKMAESLGFHEVKDLQES